MVVHFWIQDPWQIMNALQKPSSCCLAKCTSSPCVLPTLRVVKISHEWSIFLRRRGISEDLMCRRKSHRFLEKGAEFQELFYYPYNITKLSRIGRRKVWTCSPMHPDWHLYLGWIVHIFFSAFMNNPFQTDISSLSCCIHIGANKPLSLKSSKKTVFIFAKTCIMIVPQSCLTWTRNWRLGHEIVEIVESQP